MDISVRFLTVLALLLAGAACGGTSSPPSSDAAETPAAEDDFTAPPLEIPEDCEPAASEYEISTVGARWADSKGRQYDIDELCLTVPADQDFTVTVHNLKVKGVLNLPHNFAIYSDSYGLDQLFLGKQVGPGKDRTYEVPGLAAGPYLYRCDLHAQQMSGILVVE